MTGENAGRRGARHGRERDAGKGSENVARNPDEEATWLDLRRRVQPRDRDVSLCASPCAKPLQEAGLGVGR